MINSPLAGVIYLVKYHHSQIGFAGSNLITCSLIRTLKFMKSAYTKKLSVELKENQLKGFICPVADFPLLPFMAGLTKAPPVLQNDGK